ncbi:alpha/beta hydrolase [Streptomyces cacaoi]|uniref:alpha/beta hydrolase n=1 Tax=Streptomyces cacaoi TaxID=1898 RepID=UPI002612DB44|nr:alpha/beta hydrolase [Streptomyces cacaoi]
MNYFSALGNPLSGPGLSTEGVSGSTVWRALFALAVVLVLLATTGWTAVRGNDVASGPRAAALQAWEKGSFAGRPLPDPDSSPRRIAHWFKTLDPGQQRTLAQRYPLVVGNLGGAPLKLRYRANHQALVQARDTERRRMTDERLTDEGRHDAGRRMHRYESMLRPGRQFIAFDPTDRGRAAEVFGDLQHAERLSVVVPGVDTEMLTFERSSRRYSAPVGMASALQRQQQSTAPSERTATVAWAGYNAPAGLGVEAASGGPAQEGAKRLNSFLRAVPASTDGAAPKMSLFCHSYGSVVCGVAAKKLPRSVTDIAVAGSPGMRADNARQLKTRAHIWATRDRDDWIADVPHMNVGGLGHGADPVSKAFGARRISSADSVGHTGYFVPGTRSLANFAAIGTGSYSAVDCDTSDPDCSPSAL